MKLFFLGGAAEVGASCTLVEIEGHRVLVDAGIRMGAAPGSHLPNLSILDEVGPPEEVLVTHAHMDHTGALPALVGGLPDGAPIRCTAPTQAITRVLLTDALKIMSIREEQEGELPLYPPEAVDACLGRMSHVPFLTSVSICGGALSATWIPAGHILGAASVYIEGRRESVLVSGDISVANQMTIPGMAVPQCRPDVLVIESTYGNRQHADRSQQEARLAMRVAEVIEAEAKVLIPAFAVGRAQEVVLILSRAMRRKEIPSFPIFVDGMVRSVNAVYGAFPEELAPPLRRRVQRGESAFYSDFVAPVSVPADRTRVLEGPPCCIVASSGMLNGGASSFYAQRLAKDAGNLIAITGYQDEESPGRALMNLTQAADPAERVLMLNGQQVTVASQVETYSLSAHADSGELASLARRIAPRSVCLVHGDHEARAALASVLDLHIPEGVHLPENGGFYRTDPEMSPGRRRRYGHAVPMHGISGGREADVEALQAIRAYLLETGAKGPFRVQALAEIWHGTAETELPQVEAFKTLLDGPQSCFEADHRRPYLYRVAEEKKDGGTAEGPMEMNEARGRIQTAFPPDAGLVKCSAYIDEGVYELVFHFPDVIAARYREQLQKLETETGWKIRLRDTPHQGRLFEEALAAVPEGATPLKAPALRMEQREVAVAVAVAEALRPEWERLAEAAAAHYEETTGYRLVLLRPEEAAAAAPARAPAGAWEINRAYEEIRKAFGVERHRPYRMGLKSGGKGQHIELAFISPAVGERYRELMDRLASRIGWLLQVRGSVNQEQIAQEARRITPADCMVRGTPSFYPGEGRVVVPVVEAPPEADRPALEAAFCEATGFGIAWEAGKTGQ